MDLASSLGSVNQLRMNFGDIGNSQLREFLQVTRIYAKSPTPLVVSSTLSIHRETAKTNYRPKT